MRRKAKFFRLCPALGENCNTHEKVQIFWKLCRNKHQPNSGTFNKQNSVCEEKMILQSNLQHRRWKSFILKNKPVTWKSISENKTQMKMLVDTGMESTVMSSKIWTELGKPQLDGIIRHLEACDIHQLTVRRSFTFWRWVERQQAHAKTTSSCAV